MEMTDEEYDYNKIVKGLCSIDSLDRLEEKYKDKPYILEQIQKAKRDIVVKRLIEFEDEEK